MNAGIEQSLAFVPRRVSRKLPSHGRGRGTARSLAVLASAQSAPKGSPEPTEPAVTAQPPAAPSGPTVTYPVNVLLHVSLDMADRRLASEPSERPRAALSPAEVERRVRRVLEKVRSHSIEYVVVLDTASPTQATGAEDVSAAPDFSVASSSPPSPSAARVHCIVRTCDTSHALALLAAFPTNVTKPVSATDADTRKPVHVLQVRLLSKTEQTKHWSQVPARVRRRAALKARGKAGDSRRRTDTH